jgi:hypothetical protein
MGDNEARRWEAICCRKRGNIVSIIIRTMRWPSPLKPLL